LSERSVARAIAQQFPRGWYRGYAAAKLRSDPAYAEAVKSLRGAAGPILDVGCGIGLLACYLRLHGIETAIVGVDSDPRKIAVAKRVVEPAIPGTAFRVATAIELFDFGGSVALIDLLHYLTEDEQRTLLSRAARSLPPGGAIFIRECLRDSTWRYRLTYLEETFATKIGWLRAPRLNFPTRALIEEVFASESLEIDIRPLWGRTPFNNYVVTARRPARS
jgi:SAM-dependent methyltransferase